MLVLITYDVSTTTSEGRRRLSQVARKCQDHGQRVQNSVFECLLDAAQLRKLKFELEELIDKQTDSLRFYNLGDKYKSRVEHMGAKASFDMEGPLII
ncbi:CRISPR-associated endonuclease Cas2 [compost metagenome]